jgi:hypothetical protein
VTPHSGQGAGLSGTKEVSKHSQVPEDKAHFGVPSPLQSKVLSAFLLHETGSMKVRTPLIAELTSHIAVQLEPEL